MRREFNMNGMTPFLRSIIDLNLTPIEMSLSGAGEIRPPIDVAFSSAKNAANSNGREDENSDGLRIRNVNKDIFHQNAISSFDMFHFGL